MFTVLFWCFVRALLYMYIFTNRTVFLLCSTSYFCMLLTICQMSKSKKELDILTFQLLHNCLGELMWNEALSWEVCIVIILLVPVCTVWKCTDSTEDFVNRSSAKLKLNFVVALYETGLRWSCPDLCNNLNGLACVLHFPSVASHHWVKKKRNKICK